MKAREVEKAPLENCLNCNHHIETTDAYCASCGQRTRESRISSWQLIGEFFRTVVNIDSKFFKSLGLLFFPSRLTSDYIQGKRARYINPARFFFVALIIYFGLLTLVLNNKLDIAANSTNIMDEIRQDVDHAKLSAKFDKLVLDFPNIDSTDADSLKQKLLGTSNELHQDSISDFKFNIGSLTLGNSFAKTDLVHLSSDEFVGKYGGKSYTNKVVIRQMYRSLHNPIGAVQFLIGNLLWVVVLLALFSAFSLKLLYIRGNYYLVDHLILSLFMYSYSLLCLSLYLLLEFYITNGDGYNSKFSIILITIPLYAFFSIKRYYKQGWFKTFVKFILLSFYLLTILFIFVAFVIMVSLLIY